MGFRRAYPVASYLTYVFEKMSVPSMQHDGVGKLDHRFALRTGMRWSRSPLRPIPRKHWRLQPMRGRVACRWLP
ncbi:hypothetical protein ACFSHQ_14800 [Gemmobacter lanyuensis]